MQTDVTLIGQGKTVIIDCKYYSDALQHHHGTDKFLSGNLYQIHAYLTNHAARQQTTRGVGGLLCIPQRRPHSPPFTTPRAMFWCAHVNLDQPWKATPDLLSLWDWGGGAAS
jgi:5-methylcytosine-specific restriction endonuclease McrBC regulatory subunit McrC